VLPPTTGTGSFPAEQDSSGGASSQGGLTSDTGVEEADVLDRSRLHILSLEREQRLLAEQNGKLESLLDNRKRQQGRLDKTGQSLNQRSAQTK